MVTKTFRNPFAFWKLTGLILFSLTAHSADSDTETQKWKDLFLNQGFDFSLRQKAAQKLVQSKSTIAMDAFLKAIQTPKEGVRIVTLSYLSLQELSAVPEAPDHLIDPVFHLLQNSQSSQDSQDSQDPQQAGFRNLAKKTLVSVRKNHPTSAKSIHEAALPLVNNDGISEAVGLIEVTLEGFEILSDWLLNHSNPKIRAEAATELGGFIENLKDLPPKDVLKVLMESLTEEKDPEVLANLQATFITFGNVTNAQQVIHELSSFVQKGGQNGANACVAAECLSRLDLTRGLATLIHYWMEDPDPETQQYAQKILERLLQSPLKKESFVVQLFLNIRNLAQPEAVEKNFLALQIIAKSRPPVAEKVTPFFQKTFTDMQIFNSAQQFQLIVLACYWGDAKVFDSLFNYVKKVKTKPAKLAFAVGLPKLVQKEQAADAIVFLNEMIREGIPSTKDSDKTLIHPFILAIESSSLIYSQYGSGLSENLQQAYLNTLHTLLEDSNAAIRSYGQRALKTADETLLGHLANLPSDVSLQVQKAHPFSPVSLLDALKKGNALK